MTTEAAKGQFGPDRFTVRSQKGMSVDAKYLKDRTGLNYIIDPSTSKPYIVPDDYDPSATADYFRRKLMDTTSDGSANPDLFELLGTRRPIYQEIFRAFKQGGWGDLQRPLDDKTDVVLAFKPAASFNLGVGAAAAKVSALEATIGGGIYNVQKNYDNNAVRKDYRQFGNVPENPPHIEDGVDNFARGTLTGPDGASFGHGSQIDGSAAGGNNGFYHRGRLTDPVTYDGSVGGGNNEYYHVAPGLRPIGDPGPAPINLELEPGEQSYRPSPINHVPPSGSPTVVQPTKWTPNQSTEAKPPSADTTANISSFGSLPVSGTHSPFGKASGASIDTRTQLAGGPWALGDDGLYHLAPPNTPWLPDGALGVSSQGTGFDSRPFIVPQNIHPELARMLLFGTSTLGRR